MVMAMNNGHFCTLGVGAACQGEDGPPFFMANPIEHLVLKKRGMLDI